VIYINEWLPNPAGPDAGGEFVELYNSAAAVQLNRWTLLVDGKKKVSLAGFSVPSRGYLVLKKSNAKIALKNTNGGLSLYGPDGRLVDSASFLGTAPEGRSYSRVDYGAADVQHFAFTLPSPGSKNKTEIAQIASRGYPAGVPLNPSDMGIPAFLGYLIGVAALLPAIISYAIQKNKKISELLFP